MKIKKVFLIALGSDLFSEFHTDILALVIL